MIQHPQQTWRYGQGTIEEAVLSIRPKGMFFQYDLYLTISARGLNFTSSDSVEIQMYFGLPPNAIVNDLWLWIDDNTIMKGIMLDVWTASSIYENIVKRRRDPALLTKYYGGYNLRIYPMAGDKSRKVRISYMVPAEFGTGNIYAPLPLNILKTSLNQPKGNKATVLYWGNSDFPTPMIFGANDVFESIPRIDSVTHRPYYYGTMSTNLFSQSLNLAVTSSTDTSVFLKVFPSSADSTQGYYQIAFKPANVFKLNSSQKVAILFEFNELKSNFSNITILSQLKTFLESNFTEKDSFNLIFSGTTIKRAKESGWFPGDVQAIEDAFNSIGLNSALNSDNLKELLLNGVDFIKKNDGKTMWLIASSDKAGEYTTANPILNSLRNAAIPVVPFFITDLTNWNSPYYYLNGKYYYGNEYLYENMTKLFGGNLVSYRSTYSSDIQTFFQATLESMKGTIQSFDFLTRIENGFCSNRYTTNVPSTGELPVDRTISQVGKYSGSFPFIVEIAGMYKGLTFNKKVSFTDDVIIREDSSLETIWASRFLSSLEAITQTSSVQRTIIETSMQYRILSTLTAFLALEPNDTLKACVTCRDESKLVMVKPVKPLIPSNDSLVFAYPNPFNPSTTLKIRLPKGETADNSSLQIFNVLGQLIKTFDVGSLTDDKYTSMTWQGDDNTQRKVSSGVYFATLSTRKGRFSIKLVLMK